MNIEQLAIEHGEETFSAISRNENGDAVVGVAYIFTKDELEAFAKAYAQQQSEPVAELANDPIFVYSHYMAKIITKNDAHPRTIGLVNGTKLYTQPPNTVSLEQYNKLLVWVKLLGVEVEKLGITLTIEGKNFKQSIEEAERSAK